MRDTLTTDLGRYLHDYSPLRKTDISPETLLEIAVAYCVRSNVSVPQMSDVGSYAGIPVIILDLNDEDLELRKFTEFNAAYKAHGYSAPLLFIKAQVDDTSIYKE